MKFQDRYRSLEFQNSRSSDNYGRVFPMEVYDLRKERRWKISDYTRVEIVSKLHQSIPRLIDYSQPKGERKYVCVRKFSI